jgi:hypothetical protein
LIREISDTGARLLISDSVALPDEVELFIPHKNQTFSSQIAWRRGEEVGVTFKQPMAADASDLTQRLSRLEEEIAGLKRLIKKLKADSGPETEVA